MESYAFRPNKTGLPKLTNSTFYKTSKLAKTKNNSTIDINIQNLSNINNNTSQTNKSIKSNSKSIKNNNNIQNIIKKKINFSKLPSKHRSLSNIHINISSQKTDDNLFALSQIKNMDRFIEKRINKKVVWKQKARNIYDENTAMNTQKIKDIKNYLHQSRFEDSKNFDLKNEINKKNIFLLKKFK